MSNSAAAGVASCAVTSAAPDSTSGSAGWRPAPSSGTPTAIVSPAGTGRPLWPIRLSTGGSAFSSSPSPPSASATRVPVTPISASPRQTAGTPPSPPSPPFPPSPSFPPSPGSAAPGHADRISAGVARAASSASAASRSAAASSATAKRIEPVPFWSGARQAEQALGDDVALDLVGARVDRPGQRELEAAAPWPLRLGVRAEQFHRGLVQPDVELGPVQLVQAGPGAGAVTGHDAGDLLEREQVVSAGLDPGLHDPVPQARIQASSVQPSMVQPSRVQPS